VAVALVVAPWPVAVGVGAVTRRRPFVLPGFVGRRLVGTEEEVAATLRVTAEEVARAIAEARLERWGLNGAGRPVWRVADAARALGFPEPPRPRRGAPQFRITIPGTRGRRSRQKPPSGQEWPLELEEGA
jgi:hypothetical protein